ncbi:MAG: hypothetical protein LBT81_01690 [Helicobacteraceae bacterium]|nr:hypothetical protein [Helicobacteraceae bacterium]
MFGVSKENMVKIQYRKDRLLQGLEAVVVFVKSKYGNLARHYGITACAVVYARVVKAESREMTRTAVSNRPIVNARDRFNLSATPRLKNHDNRLQNTGNGAVEYFTIASGAVRTVTGRPKMVYIRSWAGSKSDVVNIITISINNDQMHLEQGVKIGDSYSSVHPLITLLVMPGDTYKVTIYSSTYYNGDGVIYVYERSI